ncbi:MAG: hypothetical protein JSV32_04560 [Dehalococcoidia bacterium]|nr:MAG: hypothetical protein JSV32_04560 [Dehalococcoidia bacterium]
MRYYGEDLEIVPFRFIKYIILIEVGLSIVFAALFIMQQMGNLVIEDELPVVFFLIMALIILAIAAILTTLAKLRIGITQDLLRASLRFIKFEVPLSSITNVYQDEKSSLKYGSWGVRMRKYKEDWVLAYTTIGYERVRLELEGHRYKRFVFATAHSEEVTNVLNQQRGD